MLTTSLCSSIVLPVRHPHRPLVHCLYILIQLIALNAIRPLQPPHHGPVEGGAPETKSCLSIPGPLQSRSKGMTASDYHHCIFLFSEFGRFLSYTAPVHSLGWTAHGADTAISRAGLKQGSTGLVWRTLHCRLAGQYSILGTSTIVASSMSPLVLCVVSDCP